MAVWCFCFLSSLAPWKSVYETVLCPLNVTWKQNGEASELGTDFMRKLLITDPVSRTVIGRCAFLTSLCGHCSKFNLPEIRHLFTSKLFTISSYYLFSCCRICVDSPFKFLNAFLCFLLISLSRNLSILLGSVNVWPIVWGKCVKNVCPRLWIYFSS